MKLRTLILTTGVFLAVFTMATIQAQENRYEINVGANFPLVSRTLEVKQGLGYQVSFGYRISEILTLGLVYDTRTVEDDLGSDFDVDIDLYGVRGIWQLAGDTGFEMIGVTSIGVGDLSWANQGAHDPIFLNDTTIDLWYEIGAGAQFQVADRWTFRCLATIRGMHPKDSSVIMKNSRTEFVPTFSVGLRF